MRISPSVRSSLKIRCFFFYSLIKMQVILILSILAQIYGVLSIHVDPHAKDPTIQELDSTLQIVSVAVDEAITNVSRWINSEINDRLSLLTELQTYHYDLLLAEIELSRQTTNNQQMIVKLNSIFQKHVTNINRLLTALIPTIEDFTGTYAVTSCLRLVQITESEIDKFNLLLSA